MITLEKITVQIGQKLFSQSTKKLLRIQTQNQIIKTKNIAKPISQTSLQWDETIQVPLVYGQDIPFEIYEKHEFGYNPEEIQSVLHGVISFIQGNDKFINWELFDLNGKKIGFLSVNIKNKATKAVSFQKSDTKLSSPVKKVVDETQLVVISSIVVNVPSIKAKRAFAVVSIGEQHIKTSPSKSKAGELVFVQKYELEKNQFINEGTIDIYSCGSDQPDEKVASANLKLQKRIDRKLNFMDSQGNQIGQGFVDGKIQLKSDALADKMFASIIRQGFHKQIQEPGSQTMKLNNKTFNDLSKSIMSNRNFITSERKISPNGKKISVINHNSNIRIPQQRRFFSTRDPPNNKCSYLPEQSLEFKQKNTNKYYRGASLGYGDKIDFTSAKKDLPSVGKYKLPSIWDRY